MTVIVISSFGFILLVGYVAIYRRYSKNLTDITFAGEYDVTSTDDALLRHLGSMEKIVEALGKHLKNPIVWFRIGFQKIISLPLYILNWFGILSDRAVNNVTANFLHKIISGIGGLVTFVSSVVTTIQLKMLRDP